MRVILQRVSEADVVVSEEGVGEIDGIEELCRVRLTGMILPGMIPPGAQGAGPDIEGAESERAREDHGGDPGKRGD